jgi:hypothetical protein
MKTDQIFGELQAFVFVALKIRKFNARELSVKLCIIFLDYN